jgi:hypothetical protein
MSALSPTPSRDRSGPRPPSSYSQHASRCPIQPCGVASRARAIAVFFLPIASSHPVMRGAQPRFGFHLEAHLLGATSARTGAACASEDPGRRRGQRGDQGAAVARNVVKDRRVMRGRLEGRPQPC